MQVLAGLGFKEWEHINGSSVPVGMRCCRLALGCVEGQILLALCVRHRSSQSLTCTACPPTLTRPSSGPSPDR